MRRPTSSPLRLYAPLGHAAPKLDPLQPCFFYAALLRSPTSSLGFSHFMNKNFSISILLSEVCRNYDNLLYLLTTDNS